jgi:single-strand DNA-binding protein
MNETTVHGNVTADPTVRRNPDTGRVVTGFSVAVNSGWYDRTRNQYVNRPPVFHQVVCFGDLAANAGATVKKGMTVTVTGSWADDSYTPNGSERIVRRIRLEATDVAVSLRWATAAVTRQQNPASPTETTPEPTGTDAPAEPQPATA